MFQDKQKKGKNQSQRSVYQAETNTNAVNNGHIPVSYAEAVPAEPSSSVQVIAEPVRGEEAQCRRCGQVFIRNPRYNDCDGRYYRCERCVKPESLELNLLSNCVVS